MANNFIFPQGSGVMGNGGGLFGGNGGNGIGDFLLGSMMGCGGMGGFGGWGGMGGMMYLWPWLFLACGRNGGWFGGDGNGNNTQLTAIQETLQTMQGNQAVLSAIKGGESEIRELSNQTGLSFSAVQGAIGSLKDVLVAIGNQNGLNFNQMIHAVDNGKCDIISQLKDCCCGTKEQILDLKGNIINGFSQIGYALRDQTCNLEKAGDQNTRAILAKMDQIEDSRKDREIAALNAQLLEARNDAKRKEELLPLFAKLDKIECNQPATKTVPADCGRYISPCEGLLLQLLSTNGGGLLRNLLGLNGGGTTAAA